MSGMSPELIQSLTEAVGIVQAQKEQIDSLRAQQQELEQFVAAMPRGGGGGGGMGGQSFGAAAIEALQKDPAFEALRAGTAKSVRVRVPMAPQAAITTATYPLRPDRDAFVVPMVRRGLRIRDVLRVIPTISGSIEYVQQNTRTNAAAPVAEGAAKPYSDYAWELKTATVRVIAHLAKASKQILDDVPGMQAMIDGEMRYGVQLIEEAQILNGDGTGQNLNGIVTQATAYSAPITIASPTSIDMIRLAIAQLEVADMQPSAVILNPADWAFIETLKTTDGAYILIPGRGADGQEKTWQLPVVSTNAMAVDKFLVGDFQTGAALRERQELVVEISTENADDFEKNLVTLRAEERIALQVFRPGAFIYGDFGRVV